MHGGYIYTGTTNQIVNSFSPPCHWHSFLLSKKKKKIPHVGFGKYCIMHIVVGVPVVVLVFLISQ